MTMLNAARTFASRAAVARRVVAGTPNGRGVLPQSASASSVAFVPEATPASSSPSLSLSPPGRCPIVARPFSSKKKVVDVRRSQQREIWKIYLQTGVGAADLFDELDLNYSSTISVSEINYFLDSVDREGVSKHAFQTLQKLGADHELDLKEFRQWLGIATGSEDSDDSDSDSDDEEEASAPEPPAKEPAPPAASGDAPKKKVVDARRGLQELVWDHYLTTGKNAADLFLMIDLNKNRSISVLEIKYFLESVGRKGVQAEEFDRLLKMGDDHELTEDEFMQWLDDATRAKK